MALNVNITSQDIVSGNLLEIMQQIVTSCHALATSLSVTIDLPTAVEPFDIINENLVRLMNKILVAVTALENA